MFAISFDSAEMSCGFGENQRLDWHKGSYGRGNRSAQSLMQVQKLDVLMNMPCTDKGSPGCRGMLHWQTRPERSCGCRIC